MSNGFCGTRWHLRARLPAVDTQGTRGWTRGLTSARETSSSWLRLGGAPEGLSPVATLAVIDELLAKRGALARGALPAADRVLLPLHAPASRGELQRRSSGRGD